MIDIKNEYSQKHREDVIDTLKLRARERRVLYGLIIILLLTVSYENGGGIFSLLVSGDYATPTLGNRRKLTIKPEIMKTLARELEPLPGIYPQYAIRLKKDAGLVADAVQMASTPELAERAVEASREAVLHLYEFTSHPVITRTKNLEALEKELFLVAKILQIKLVNKGNLPELSFKKAAPMVENTGERNLFDYN